MTVMAFPAAVGCIAAGSTPATAVIEPSRPNSPSTVKPESASDDGLFASIFAIETAFAGYESLYLLAVR